jgi:hypothetical protein
MSAQRKIIFTRRPRIEYPRARNSHENDGIIHNHQYDPPPNERRIVS